MQLFNCNRVYQETVKENSKGYINRKFAQNNAGNVETERVRMK